MAAGLMAEVMVLGRKGGAHTKVGCKAEGSLIVFLDPEWKRGGGRGGLQRVQCKYAARGRFDIDQGKCEHMQYRQGSLTSRVSKVVLNCSCSLGCRVERLIKEEEVAGKK